MERQPKFLRDFSKEKSLEERQTTAREIRAKRAQYFARKDHQTSELETLKQEMTEQERKLADQLEQIQNLQAKIDELSSLKVSKLLNYFELKKLRTEMTAGQKSHADLESGLQTKREEESSLQSQEQGDAKPEFQEAREMLKTFYDQEKEKWANSEYDKDEITKYFSEEHLASLSVEDYALLLKRFPNEMVAHVTRQGIRDHTGMMFHTAGVGEYTPGFMKMVQDGRLRAPLGVYLAEADKKKAIADFFGLQHYESREQALTRLDDFTKGAGMGEYQGTYPDKMAVHFAVQEVADMFYGSERYNEIFMIYPSAHVASQYFFHSQVTKGGGDVWNDTWVYANEERGMDINAGVIFIPKDTPVNSDTGSRYELDKNNNPVINQASVDSVWVFANSNDFEEFQEAVEKTYDRLPDTISQPRRRREEEIIKRQEPLRKQLAENFGIRDPRLQDLLFYPNGILLSIQVYREKLKQGIKDEYMVANIQREMNNRGVLFVEAKQPVKSEEFWEGYFRKTGKRPSKVVYYTGGNPTQALYQWKHEQGLTKKGEPEHLGFPERRTERNTPIAYSGVDRFRSLAQEVIEEHFSQKAN